MNRKKWQADLVYELGQLLSPLQKIVDVLISITRKVALARVRSSCMIDTDSCGDFVNSSGPSRGIRRH